MLLRGLTSDRRPLLGWSDWCHGLDTAALTLEIGIANMTGLASFESRSILRARRAGGIVGWKHLDVRGVAGDASFGSKGTARLSV